MAKFNSAQRFLRKCSLLRRLALIDAQRTRRKLREANWLYRHSVLASVGLLVSTWSGIERMLDTLIAQYHPVRFDPLKKEKLPTLLGQKLKYLNLMTGDNRIPDQLRASLQTWLPELKRLGQHRNLIVHGNLWHGNPYQMEWRVQKLMLKGHLPVFEEHIFTNAHLEVGIREASNLHARIAQTLRPILFPAETQKTEIGEIGTE